jgi:prophage regulatory protein
MYGYGSPPHQILRCKQVAERLALSRSCIYDKLAPNSPRFDPSFPRPIRLGLNAVGWVSTDIDDWLRNRIHQANQVSRNTAPESSPMGAARHL